MKRGFTLAELLIALAILGVIATFAIPKVLQAQQDASYKAMAKEAAGTVSEAFQVYKMKQAVTSSFKPSDLTPYLNYVRMDTATVIDAEQTRTTYTCGAANRGPCALMHNGARVLFYDYGCMGGTSPSHHVWFTVDPDGQVTESGSTTQGKSVGFALYYSGALKTTTTIDGGIPIDWVCDGGANDTDNPAPGTDPPWFSWD